MTAHEEITQALLRYCRGIDRMDAELVRSAYHDDAVDDHGDAFSGSIDAYLAWVMPVLAERFTSTMHTLSNVSIELDGDRAHVESYLVAYHVVAGDEALRVLGARYVDDFTWRDGVGWRIQHRRLVPEWQLQQRGFVAVPGVAAPARRDAGDPSYG
ncbi:MAG: nuclear transport factor 2 family protein [Mycobacteriales bacterium]